MPKFHEKKIHASNLEPGMVIARSIYSKGGNILISAGVTLNEVTVKQLQSIHAAGVYIKEFEPEIPLPSKPEARPNTPGTPFSEIIDIKIADIEKHTDIHSPTQKASAMAEVVVPMSINAPLEILNSIPSSFTQREEFKHFEEDYNKKETEVKNSLREISDGALLDVNKLYDLTDGIMGKLKNKGDVFMYLNNLKMKDEYTFSHSANVSMLANVFGSWLKMNESDITRLTVAGVLHDIGKTMIPDEVLNKKGKLTAEEFGIIKKHTTFGYQILTKQKNADTAVRYAALMHHEKLDGTGYPLGLKDAQIEKFAKIIAICDIYDAMTANRVYRPKICPFDVIKQFEQSSYGQIDTTYLLVFLRNIAGNYVGANAVLTDGRVGEIVFINNNDLSRPVMKIKGEVVDLHKEHVDIAIVAVK